MVVVRVICQKINHLIIHRINLMNSMMGVSQSVHRKHVSLLLT